MSHYQPLLPYSKATNNPTYSDNVSNMLPRTISQNKLTVFQDLAGIISAELVTQHGNIFKLYDEYCKIHNLYAAMDKKAFENAWVSLVDGGHVRDDDKLSVFKEYDLLYRRGRCGDYHNPKKLDVLGKLGWLYLHGYRWSKNITLDGIVIVFDMRKPAAQFPMRARAELLVLHDFRRIFGCSMVNMFTNREVVEHASTDSSLYIAIK